MASAFLPFGTLRAFSTTAEAVLKKQERPGYLLGPLILAALFDCCLLGILTVACFSYSRQFGHETWKFKGLVLVLFLVNLAQSTMSIYTMYTMFGSGFGNWEGTLTNLYFESILMMEAVCGALSQIFFLDRALTLLRSQKQARRLLLSVCIPGILVGLSLGLASGIVTVISANSTTDFGAFNLLDILIESWKALTIATDLVITSNLVVCLLNRRTSGKDGNGLATTLVRFILEAQSLPLACSIFFLVCYVVDPAANICLIPSFAEGKLAAISVLHVLNSRTQFRQSLSAAATDKPPRHDGDPSLPPPKPTPSRLMSLGRINIQTETIQVISERDLAIDLESQENWEMTHTRLADVKSSPLGLDDDRTTKGGGGSSRGNSIDGQGTTVVKPFEDMIW